MAENFRLDTEIAIVKSIENGVAQVQMKQTGSCDSCGLNGFCHAGGAESLIPLKTDLNLKPGDEVKVYLNPGSKIFSSALIFLFPIFTMVLFYFLVRNVFNLAENFAILASFLGLIISGMIIKFLDNKLSNKIKFEIVGKVENENSPE